MLTRGCFRALVIFLPLAMALGAHDARSAPPAAPFRVVESVDGAVTMRVICGVEGFRPCSETLPSIVKQVGDMVRSHVDAAYQGRHINPFGKGEADRFLEGTLVQTPLCNLGNQAYPGGPERSLNHLKQDCGKTCAYSCAAPQAGSSLPRVTCRLDDPKTHCLAERAWARGALAQLVWSKLDEVAKELGDAAQGNRIRLQPKCEAVVTDPKLAKLFEGIEKEVKRYQEVNGGRPPSCSQAPGAKQSPSSEDGSEMAACYLTSSRAALETVVSQVAVCEVFARAEDSYPVEAAHFAAIPHALIKKAVKSSNCSSLREDAQKFQACVNQYYSERIRDRFLDQMGSYRNAPTTIQGLAPSNTL